MLSRYKVGFFGAALVASLVACHPAKPAQSASSASAAQCADASTVPASASREAREVIGSAPTGASRTPCAAEAPAKRPAAAPDADDQMWRLDMP
jgi:hypothetical protein